MKQIITNKSVKSTCHKCDSIFFKTHYAQKYCDDCRGDTASWLQRHKSAAEVAKNLSFGWIDIDEYKKQCEITEIRSKL